MALALTPCSRKIHPLNHQQNNSKPTAHPERSQPLLIHTAMLSEARALIDMLQLKQHETQPFKVFRAKHICLIVSGIGVDNTQNALQWIFQNESFFSAINIGIAGCSKTTISVGSAFSISKITDAQTQSQIDVGSLLKNSLNPLPSLPLLTVSRPQCNWKDGIVELADMEGSIFHQEALRHLSNNQIGLIKIVSDHGSDQILPKAQIHSIMQANIDKWISGVLGFTDKKTPTAQATKSSVWHAISQSRPFLSLDPKDRQALQHISIQRRFSFSQLKQLVDFALDFRTWGEVPLAKRIEIDASHQKLFKTIANQWEQLKTEPKSYAGFKGAPAKSITKKITLATKDTLGFGSCPVASPKTRCCNLLTLDAVEGCAFDCSYCAVKTFYQPGQVTLNANFAEKINALHLDATKPYHIGTGQSSDSLLLGNKEGVLDALLNLARRYPNVVLEFKTKSANINYLLEQDLPPNLICTWSLNTETIVNAEEHGTATLQERIGAAAQIAQKGTLVGFHFHPIVEYQHARQEYSHLFQHIQSRFSPADVALISFGTLTFTKPIIKQLRNISMRSKVLQMPLVDIAGKFSYPHNTKQEMFRHAYCAFEKWHKDVFFYLCMEDITLWPQVFGYEYPNNEAFESAMIASYQNKIHQKITTSVSQHTP